MGSSVSCTRSTQTASGNLRPATKVIFPTGEVRQLLAPTNAAELMLETPNHFVVSFRSLRAGRRFSALSADDDLEMGSVYVMLPMKRLKSTVTASDLGPLFLVASSSSKRESSSSSSGAGRVRVSPESVEVHLEGTEQSSGTPKLSLDLEGIEELSMTEFMRLMSMSRSKKPLLETILEEQQVHS